MRPGVAKITECSFCKSLSPGVPLLFTDPALVMWDGFWVLVPLRGGEIPGRGMETNCSDL